MTLIKICGITSVSDAIEVAKLDVQVIGLVFAESRRRVSLQQAARICSVLKELPARPYIAGVFVNINPQIISETIRLCGLDLVQLSGDESMDCCRSINAPVIKAIRISPASRSRDILKVIKNSGHGNPVIYLLDTADGRNYGGTGKSFDWSIAREVAASYPVIIAGGLNPRNVGGVVSYVNPAGVDVSSGVETDGHKDIAKIRAFVNAARAAERPSSDNSNLLYKYTLKGGLNVT